MPMEKLIEETYSKFNTDFIQKYTALATPEAKLDHCTKVIKSSYISRPPLKPVDITVIGIGRVGNTRSGGKRGEVYVAVEEEQRDKSKISVLRPIAFTGKDCDKIEQLQPPSPDSVLIYPQVHLGKFRDGSFIADDRTTIPEPIKVDMPIMDFLQNELHIKRCTIAEAAENLAKLDSTATGEYVSKTDLRIIRGMIGSHQKSQDTGDGQAWGGYTITDDSLDEDQISIDGEKLTKQAFPIWVNPYWVVYERGNEVDFVGTISLSKGSAAKPKERPYQVSMSAVLLVPSNLAFGGIKE